MGLIDLKTDLKSLKYGHDRPGGGDSGQPYIKTNINTVDSGINKLRLTTFDDGLIRGGAIGVLNSSITDTLRISKFLVDFPKGPLFIAKQVGLQLSNPRLETRKLPSSSSPFLNFIANAVNTIQDIVPGPTRLYNLGINTLAQVPINAIGGHINRHGILPIQNENTKYIKVVYNNNQNGQNRLENLLNGFNLGNGDDKRTLQSSNKFKKFINAVTSAATGNIPSSTELVIDSYLGGPGSTYGIGSTLIKRYDVTRTTEQGIKDRTNPYQVKNIFEPIVDLGKGNNAISNYNSKIPTDSNDIKSGISSPAFTQYALLSAQIDKQQQLKNPDRITPISGSTGESAYYNQFGIFNTSRGNIKDTGNDVLNANGFYSSDNIENIAYKNSYGDVVTVRKSNWAIASRENRIGSGRQDQINLTPIFSADKYFGNDTAPTSSVDRGTHNIRDLVKFRIQSVSTNTPNVGDWMIFRAYLTNLSDNVDASWNEVKYAGRGDKFYIYDGFSRKIQIGFKVAALSEKEMKPMYQKLNYLMSNLMPDYENNLMRGPLVRMTIGNYIDSQLGKLDSVSYTIPNDSPWEIAIDEPEGGSKLLILPHIIEVSLSFTPIGSESKLNNELSQKSQNISNIAQNNTGADAKTLQYV